MTLGDWVRIVRAFIGGLSPAVLPRKEEQDPAVVENEPATSFALISSLIQDLSVRTMSIAVS